MKTLWQIGFRTVFVVSTLLVVACSGVSVLNGISPEEGYTLYRNLAFGQHQLSLDVYQPPSSSGPRPVIVFLYGGSWQEKSTFPKEDYRFVGAALALRGYVVVIPDYRLYPAVSFPSFLDDCAEAVAWAHDNARQYGGDTERLVLMGHSAGAYNAAMLSTDDRYLQRVGGSRKWIKALIGLAGPYDFLPLVDPGLQQLFNTATPLTASQPINHVDGAVPPALLLAGANDSIVYVKNTENFAATLREHGDEVDEFVYPNMSHIKIIATLGLPLQQFSDVADRVDRYIVAKTAASN